MVANFSRVAAPELLPACRVVPEPLPQRRARSNFLDPAVDGCVRLSDAAWPQPIDQYPLTITRRGRAIRPLQLDMTCEDFLWHLVPPVESDHSLTHLMSLHARSI